MIIYFTVTNDLTYDQRMIRICNSLANAGYKIILVGRKQKRSIALTSQSFLQKRLYCFFEKGKLFYAEYNLKLFIYLLFKKTNAICAIDLDTILPCYFISKIKNTKRIYDAHELFCEMKEIVSRPSVYSIWKEIEKYSVPKFKNGYTVNQLIAKEFNKMYGVNYEVIRSVALKKDVVIPEKIEKYILYQGAVNEGRCFETLIPAMKHVNATLIICGDGNYFEQTKELIRQHELEQKVILKGKITPDNLHDITLNAHIGVTLFDVEGLSNYYSLANRFFDYMHAGIPQVCVDYPVYKEINEKYQVAVLQHDLSPISIAKSLNNLLADEDLYKQLQCNCMLAREEFCWQNEEKNLISFYKKIFE